MRYFLVAMLILCSVASAFAGDALRIANPSSFSTHFKFPGTAAIGRAKCFTVEIVQMPEGATALQVKLTLHESLREKWIIRDFNITRDDENETPPISRCKYGKGVLTSGANSIQAAQDKIGYIDLVLTDESIKAGSRYHVSVYVHPRITNNDTAQKDGFLDYDKSLKVTDLDKYLQENMDRFDMIDLKFYSQLEKKYITANAFLLFKASEPTEVVDP